jgi:hypothetical protein
LVNDWSCLDWRGGTYFVHIPRRSWPLLVSAFSDCTSRRENRVCMGSCKRTAILCRLLSITSEIWALLSWPFIVDAWHDATCGDWQALNVTRVPNSPHSHPTRPSHSFFFLNLFSSYFAARSRQLHVPAGGWLQLCPVSHRPSPARPSGSDGDCHDRSGG